METRVAMIRRDKPGVTAVTPPTIDQPTGRYTCARSGGKVLILAENERGGYRAITMPCYIHSEFWQWSGKILGGDYVPHLPKDSVEFIDE